MARSTHHTMTYGTSTFYNMLNHTGRPYALASGFSVPTSRATPFPNFSTRHNHYPTTLSAALHSINLGLLHTSRFKSPPQLTKVLPNSPQTCSWHAPTQINIFINSLSNHFQLSYPPSPESPQPQSPSTPYYKPYSPTPKICHLTPS